MSWVGSFGGVTGSPGWPFFGVQLGTSGILPFTTLVGSFGSVSYGTDGVFGIGLSSGPTGTMLPF